MDKKAFFLLLLTVPVILGACLWTGQNRADSGPEDLFLDYKIWGEEGNDSVTVMLFFREEGPTGPPILIPEPGFVELDGERLVADSNDMTGVYYLATKEITRFTGKHLIRFMGSNKKAYKEEFEFRPFNLKGNVPDTIHRARFELSLQGLNKQDMVRLVISDTSFPGIGIDRLETVWNNQLVLAKSLMTNLVNGPIFIELTREAGWPIERGSEVGGLVSISYTLRRESFLVD